MIRAAAPKDAGCSPGGLEIARSAAARAFAGEFVLGEVHAVRRGWTISALVLGLDRIGLGVVLPQPDGTPFAQYLTLDERAGALMVKHLRRALLADDGAAELLMVAGIEFSHGEAMALLQVLTTPAIDQGAVTV